jgi:hypothetical protein
MARIILLKTEANLQAKECWNTDLYCLKHNHLNGNILILQERNWLLVALSQLSPYVSAQTQTGSFASGDH